MADLEIECQQVSISPKDAQFLESCPFGIDWEYLGVALVRAHIVQLIPLGLMADIHYDEGEIERARREFLANGGCHQ